MNFVLIGYRGTGKTSAGKAAAEMLGLDFCDTDEIIRQQTGRSVKEIVEAGGWAAFRQQEKLAVRSLPGPGSRIVSLGGGAVLDGANIEELRKRQSVFIWLFAGPAVIAQRIENDANSAGQRPALGSTADDVAAIIRERTPIYRGLADCMIDTSDRGIGEIAESICRFIKSFGER
jgi:shikimate kinase